MTPSRPLSDREIQILTDIVGFSEAAARLVARGRGSYEGDELLPLAAEAILLKIGQAVSRLPSQLTAACPQVRWRSMRGMRNLVAHEYEVIDSTIIWNTLSRELPADAEAIRAILDRGYVDDD